jgi:NADPH:quinone reductase-like Zn-dependent oxidoreductase
MKAIQYTTYGSASVLHAVETSIPKPKPGEVLIRVHAASVTAADIMMRKGKPLAGRLYLGLKKPKRKILGFDFAGEIIETGNDVRSFKTGDRVFGGTTALGCYAEYVCVSATGVITTIPGNLSYEEAVPFSSSGITVWNFLTRKVTLQKNQKVLINGAAGGLGTYAVQLAKYFGAEVTGVCSTDNLALVKSLGADHVIDYTKEDFTQNKNQYDIIFDTVNKRSFSVCKKSLTKDGVYLTTVIGFSFLFQLMWTRFFSRKKAKSSVTGMLPVKQRLAYLKALKTVIGEGKLKSTLDQTFPLERLADAHAYVEKGHKKGQLVITV